MRSILNNLKAHSVRVRWIKEVKHRNSDESQISIGEHRKILQAMQSGDPDAVFDAVKEHIEKSAKRLFEALD